MGKYLKKKLRLQTGSINGIWVFDYMTFSSFVIVSFSSLLQCSMGGLVLDAAVEVFKGFVVFQPIINGIGGNLVSVQASRISTMLHQSTIKGIIPPHTKICEPPWRALIKGGSSTHLSNKFN